MCDNFPVCVDIIIRDDIDTFIELNSPGKYGRKLVYVAVYFHSHKILENMIQWNHLNNTDAVDIAIKVDNEVYMRAFFRYSGYMESYYPKLLAAAISLGSMKVARVISECTGVQSAEGIEPACLYVSKLMKVLADIKFEYTMYDAWYMDNEEYDNVLQWMPREILDDQLSMRERNTIENLFYF